MGDVNGHTGVLDDRGVESDAVLAKTSGMGVMGGPHGQVPQQAIPPTGQQGHNAAMCCGQPVGGHVCGDRLCDS